MRVLVVRLGSLGDLIHTLPAVAALRRAMPDATIDWLVDAAHRELLGLVPVLSSIVTLERPSAAGWLETRRTLVPRQYDIALDFQGLLKSALLSRLSGARRVMGFDRATLREPAARFFYTEKVVTTPGAHVVRKNVELAVAAGGTDGPLTFPLSEVTSPALDGLRRQGLHHFALLNCGAAWPNKRWPADRFGALAAWIRATHGLASVALWGPGERGLAEAVVAASKGAATIAPETGLRDLVALSRAASLVVSGDTGPTHIAAAVGTPVVALFGPTDPARNGPWNAEDRTIARYDRCECHYERQCRRDRATWCLASITEADVQTAVTARLQARP